jgi:hypothetical protein
MTRWARRNPRPYRDHGTIPSDARGKEKRLDKTTDKLFPEG